MSFILPLGSRVLRSCTTPHYNILLLLFYFLTWHVKVRFLSYLMKTMYESFYFRVSSKGDMEITVKQLKDWLLRFGFKALYNV